MTVLSRERFMLHPAETAMPKYEQLKSFVLAELNSGRLKPGDALPSELKLADSLQVARNTIRQALGELEQEGVIERIKGQGTFIRDMRSTRNRSLQTREMIKHTGPTRSSTHHTLAWFK